MQGGASSKAPSFSSCDALGRPTTVKVGSTTLSTNTYNSTGTLAQTTFGNGGIIDSVGTKVVEYKYDAWGKPIAKTGSMANTLGTLNPFRYRGYVYDEETNLYYLRSRFYSPDIDRFLNVDKLVSTDNSILNHNTFAYCSNNPVAFSDQDGTYKTVKLWGNWVYILDREVTSTMGKKHIVVTNGKKIIRKISMEVHTTVTKTLLEIHLIPSKNI